MNIIQPGEQVGEHLAAHAAGGTCFLIKQDLNTDTGGSGYSSSAFEADPSALLTTRTIDLALELYSEVLADFTTWKY